MNIYKSRNYFVCQHCISASDGTCRCEQSNFYGMPLEQLPWEGCRCFLSERKWGWQDYRGKPKKKRKPKWPTMEEFEFGV